MSKRTIWSSILMLLTASAVGMELWGAFDHSPNTTTWTELVVRFVPQSLATLAVSALVAWLPGHFQHAYSTQGGGGPVSQAFSRYAKFVVAAVFAGVTAAQTTVPMTPTEHAWVTVAIAVIGALAVRQVPNKPPAQQ